MMATEANARVEAHRTAISRRWIAVGVFIISSTLNYLDRQLLATLAPLIILEFRIDQTAIGWLFSMFSLVYAAGSLFAGYFLDRVGVSRGITVAVSFWSAAAVSTGAVKSFSGLVACRAALGLGESAGIPAVGKLNGVYLKPPERALGAALNQVGLSLGLALAPLWISVATAYSWRVPFVIAGLLGFVWIPAWWAISKVIPPQFGSTGPLSSKANERSQKTNAGFTMLRDKRLIALMIANVLWMGSYSLWSNWTTLYLTRVYGVSLKQSALYVWIPPVASNLGGFFGGWLSKRWVEQGRLPVAARRRAVWWSAVASLSTLAVPLAWNAGWATVIISISFFFALAGSVNIYTMPIDLYGPERSGFAIAALGCAFGLLQAVISPVVGYLADHHRYSLVVWMVAISPLLSAIVLMWVRETKANDWVRS
jgi:MFS transporter, ACS family, aldohexuronate transporter